MSKKGGKLLQLLNYRLKVTLNDSRYMIGQMLAYDKHMNLVLGDTDEFRLVKKKKTKGADMDEDEEPTVEMKRTLGLVILRGEMIVSISVEGPPPAAPEDKTSLAAGAGRAAPAGRGMGINLPGAMRGAPQVGGFKPPMPGMGGPPPGFMPPPPGFPGMPGGAFPPPPGFVPPR